MEMIDLYAPCHFGLEAVLKRELQDLHFEITETEDGRVHFRGGLDAIPRANLFLRTAERVLIKIGDFKAESFDELFEKTHALDLAAWLPEDARFWVTKANSVKSRLFSPSDIQSIVKKAIVEKLKEQYHTDTIAETGAAYPIRISIVKDRVLMGLDTSGLSLHKRGYRLNSVFAPISETLAAALILLSYWQPGRILVDPFSGSGTFPIEAALIASDTAPGLFRSFTAEDWKMIPKRLWYEASEEARTRIRQAEPGLIRGYDIDPKAVRTAEENARLAGVEQLVRFRTRDVAQLEEKEAYGFILTNPPYGERLMEKEALPELYRTLGERFSALRDWSMYVISSYEHCEADIGRKADRNRKIYNGMLKTYFYSFLGPKPKKTEEGGHA
ncbi:MAG: class I SAM-dependent RNA methyltransferase [Lachnospiraceae bacterium]|nr:class I SAM-dependent RNA methyltransferase [Lachnospiraceae bacterium]